MTIEGKLQIVTGGTSGMGLANAIELGKYGPVLVGGRSEKRLEGALEQMKAAGVKAYGKPCDVSDVESVKEFARFAQSLGEIGSVVNAAGVDWEGVSPDMIIDVNMLGVVNTTETFLPYLNDGVMVHYSSITGYFYTPCAEDYDVWNNPNDPDFNEKWQAAVAAGDHPKHSFLSEGYTYYAGSKRFVMYYTMANTVRFGKKGSRIFSIAPGSFDTPMLQSGTTDKASIAERTAFKRFGTPEEMADLVVKLMGPGHDYLTGCDIVMDGGKRAMSVAKQLD